MPMSQCLSLGIHSISAGTAHGKATFLYMLKRIVFPILKSSSNSSVRFQYSNFCWTEVMILGATTTELAGLLRHCLPKPWVAASSKLTTTIPRQTEAKMSKGVALSDADRKPWLESLQGAVREHLDRGEDVVVSCSALQLKYRDILRGADSNYKPPGTAGSYATCSVRFVCLRASAEVISERMKRRSREGKHFMPASLLQSQLDLLQIHEDEGITEVDATVQLDDIVHGTIAQFKGELASTAVDSSLF